MKFIRSVICILELAVSLSACSTKDNIEPADKEKQVIFTTGVPMMMTRTQLAPNLGVNWNKGDEIAFIDADQVLHSGRNQYESGPAASFLMETLTLDGDKVVQLQSEDCPWFTVISPRSAISLAEADGNGDIIKSVSLPAEQKLAEGTFDPQANVFFASLKTGEEYNGNSLDFRSACAMLHLKVKSSAGGNVQSIDIQAPDGVLLTGVGAFAYSRGGWYSENGSFTGTGKVTLTAETPISLWGDEYTDFYACVIPSGNLPGVSAGEYIITFTDSEGRAKSRRIRLTGGGGPGKVIEIGEFDVTRGFWMGSDTDGLAYVETIAVPASEMTHEVDVMYITPDNGTFEDRYPVIYLLHGHGEAPSEWITNKPELKRIANEKGIIFVCPDGDDSWYWDSPAKKNYRYETFISKDLVKYTDEHYQTIADRSARAITGISMGGHGALWNAIRHKDVFGAVGSICGGVDIRTYQDNWNLEDLLGNKEKYPERWDEHTVANQLDGLKNGDLAIIFDCGTEDQFFLEVNNELHEAMLERGISHLYETGKGGHSWDYGKVAVDSHISFFEQFFSRRDVDGGWNSSLNDDPLVWNNDTRFE